jgi:hypothetical protein
MWSHTVLTHVAYEPHLIISLGIDSITSRLFLPSLGLPQEPTTTTIDYSTFPHIVEKVVLLSAAEGQRTSG